MLIHLTGDDPVQALKSIRRVVKPGGVVTTRDNHRRFIYPSTPALDRNLKLFEILATARGSHPNAGHVNHVWMHEAGFEWEKIQFGSICKPLNSAEDKRMYAKNFKGSYMETFGREPKGETEKKWLKEYQRDLAEWAEKPEGRYAWYDGWVVATK